MEKNFEEYTGTLLYIIRTCSDTSEIIKDIREGSIINSGKARTMILERMAEYAILKARCLFDKNINTVSFENLEKRFQNHLDKNIWQHFNLEYKKIKNRNQELIKRLDNNRNAKVAHTQARGQLGWDETMTKKMNAWFAVSGSKPILPVTPENFHILWTNFPHKEYEAMLIDLQNLLFHDVLYPLAPRPLEKTLY